MSMDNDTRLAMMNMSNNSHRAPVRTRKARRPRLHVPSAAGLAAFALTLFTRGA